MFLTIRSSLGCEVSTCSSGYSCLLPSVSVVPRHPEVWFGDPHSLLVSPLNSKLLYSIEFSDEGWSCSILKICSVQWTVKIMCDEMIDNVNWSMILRVQQHWYKNKLILTKIDWLKEILKKICLSTDKWCIFTFFIFQIDFSNISIYSKPVSGCYSFITFK